MHLQKMILKKKESYFEEEPDKKELWKALKSLGLSSVCVQFHSKHWKTQILSKVSTLN